MRYFISSCTVLLTVFLLPESLQAAQSDTTEIKKDTLRVYKLGEIVTTKQREKQTSISPATLNKVSYQTIRNVDATSVSQLAPAVPAARVQTNSRGESLLFLRGAGERQIALYLDGALLNIPWDNRIDLSLIPTDVIGQISVSKGASSILYGANILGGAVNISTVERGSDGFGLIGRLQGGEANAQQASLLADGRFEKFSFVAFAGYTSTDGYLLPSGLDGTLDNQNPNSRIRTNTDSERLTFFARAEYDFDELSAFGLSVNHITAEKGVAAETHEGEGARFWRYPDWERTMLTLSGSHAFDERGNIELRGTVWLDIFSQQIDQYQNIDYDRVAETEIGDDITAGGRLALNWTLDKNQALAFAVSGYNSEHDEEISEFSFDETPDTSRSTAVFQQQVYSVGAEYRVDIDAWTVTAGATIDGSATPKTGPQPEQDGTTDFGALLGLEYIVAPEMSLFGSISRRTRFPTLREQFSGALGRFIPNPDLKAESGVLSEVGVKYRNTNLRLQAALFYNRYTDGIVRQSLPNRQFQRINLDESVILGSELSLGYQPVANLDLDGHITWLYARGKDSDAFDRKLEYKPEYLGALTVSYAFPFGLTPAVEMEFTGKQYGENGATDTLDELEAYTIVNLRLAYRLPFIASLLSKVFLRANNVFDTEHFSQIGLPNSGRMMHAGLEVHY